jgi:hypothetical protein
VWSHWLRTKGGCREEEAVVMEGWTAMMMERPLAMPEDLEVVVEVAKGSVEMEGWREAAALVVAQACVKLWLHAPVAKRQRRVTEAPVSVRARRPCALASAAAGSPPRAAAVAAARVLAAVKKAAAETAAARALAGKPALPTA